MGLSAFKVAKVKGILHELLYGNANYLIPINIDNIMQITGMYLKILFPTKN